MQVYLPDALHAAVKEHGLRASELLQEAVRVELRRRELLHETEAYLTVLFAEVGEPDSATAERARTIARRLSRRDEAVAG
jgi:hypothetical protein